MAATPTGTPRTTKGRAPHRRDDNARVAVLHAADDLLAERGFNGVTIEGIAARAGVAKQTIYRWWPSKVDILMDTLIEDAAERLAVPTSGSTTERARRHLRDLARFLTKDDAGRVLLALIGEAQHDQDVARAFESRFLGPLRAEERALLADGVATGDLAADLDLDAALDGLTGPIYWRALTGSAIPRSFIEGVLADVLS